MKIQSIALMTILAAGQLARANQKIQCDEVTKNPGSFHERFEIEINEKNQLISMDDNNWNDKTNTLAGSGENGYSGKKALTAKVQKGLLVYTFRTQDIGDVDYPGPKTTVSVSLPSRLQG